jgi:hypothetical protein
MLATFPSRNRAPRRRALVPTAGSCGALGAALVLGVLGAPPASAQDAPLRPRLQVDLALRVGPAEYLDAGSLGALAAPARLASKPGPPGAGAGAPAGPPAPGPADPAAPEAGPPTGPLIDLQQAPPPTSSGPVVVEQSPGTVQPQVVMVPYAAPAGPNPADPRLLRADAERQGFLPRLIVSPFVGYGIGVALGLVGALVGAVAACSDGGFFDGDDDRTEIGCVTGFAVGAAVGFLVGVPIGLHWAGSWFSGLGNFGMTLLGTLAGVALGVAVSYATESAEGVLSGGLLAVAGGMVGYELSSASESAGLRAEAGFPTARVGAAPVLADGRITGGTLHLTLGL